MAKTVMGLQRGMMSRTTCEVLCVCVCVCLCVRVCVAVLFVSCVVRALCCLCVLLVSCVARALCRLRLVSFVSCVRPRAVLLTYLPV